MGKHSLLRTVTQGLGIGRPFLERPRQWKKFMIFEIWNIKISYWTGSLETAANELRTEEMRNAYKILFGKLDEKRAPGRPKRRQENNIRMDLRETGWEGVNWIHLAKDGAQWRAVVKTVMNLWIP
jgi:hypothetical protein